MSVWFCSIQIPHFCFFLWFLFYIFTTVFYVFSAFCFFFILIFYFFIVSICQVLNSEGNFTDTKWKDLVPGDIVKVHADSQFPADLILISCSDPYGISYVGTVQLDGETSLKNKTCIPELLDLFSDAKVLSQAKGMAATNLWMSISLLLNNADLIFIY